MKFEILFFLVALPRALALLLLRAPANWNCLMTLGSTLLLHSFASLLAVDVALLNHDDSRLHCQEIHPLLDGESSICCRSSIHRTFLCLGFVWASTPRNFYGHLFIWIKLS